MTRGHPGRRVRNFLLDAKLQLHYVVQMVAVSAGLTIGLGALVYHFNAEASRVVETGVLDDDTARLVHTQFIAGQAKLVAALVVFGLLLCVVLAAWQIVTTHKIAGPLYYIKREMKKAREGRWGKLHPLRQGDMLHDFFEAFRGLNGAMRERAEQEAAALTRLATEAEGRGATAVAAELSAMAAARLESLK